MASVPRDDNFIPGILVLGSLTGADVVVEGDETTKGMYVYVTGSDVATGGTSAIDDSAFTAGTSSGTPMMGFATADTIDSGDVGVVGMDTSRNLKISLEVDNVGLATSAKQLADGHNVTVDNGAGASAVNIQDGGNSITIDGTLTGITNDVNIADGGNSITVDGTVTALPETFAGSSTYTEGASRMDLVGGVRNDTLATLADTDNEYTPMQFSSIGALYTESLSEGATGAGVTSDVTYVGMHAFGSVLKGIRSGGMNGYNNVDPDDTLAVTLYLNDGDANVDMAKGDSTNGMLVNLGSNNDVTMSTLPDTAAGDLAEITLMNAKLQSGTVIGDVRAAGSGGVLLQQASTTYELTTTVTATANATGQDTLFDADGDNTAQAIKAGAGSLYFLEVSNPNATDAYIQLFDVATGGVTVGTTTPKLSFLVPAGNGTQDGAMDKTFTVPIEFGTAITYACTVEVAGSTDPTVGLIVNAGYK